jgi:multidrug efflux pump subunit AcrB
MAISISGKLPLVKIQFFPSDYSVYHVNIKAKPETPIEQIDKKLREISQYILNDGPGKVESAAGFAGYYISDNYLPIYSNNYGAVMVTLPEKDKRSFTDPMQHLAKGSLPDIEIAIMPKEIARRTTTRVKLVRGYFRVILSVCSVIMATKYMYKNKKKGQ